MMLRDELIVHSGAIKQLDDLKVLRIEIPIRQSGVVVFLHVIKDADLYVVSPMTSAPIENSLPIASFLFFYVSCLLSIA